MVQPEIVFDTPKFDEDFESSRNAATFYPKAQEIWRGANLDIDHNSPKGWVAGLTDYPAEAMAANENYWRSLGVNPRPYLKFNAVADRYLAQKSAAAEMRSIQQQIRRGVAHPSAYQRMRQLGAALNDTTIPQITIIPFVQQITGMISMYNVISRAFTHVPANSLRGKIPEGGWPSVSVQVQRMQEPKITHTDFGQTEFRIRRNEVHLYMNKEDRMEATIDPLAFSMSQAQKIMLQVRDLLALKVLSAAPIFDYTTLPTGANSISSSSSTAFPRAVADSTAYFLDMQNEQFVHWKNQFKYIVCHPLDYRVHATNYYNRNKTNPNPPPRWGITPFVGLEEFGTVAILSPWVPRQFGYLIADEGAYELDGPKVVDAEYDAKKFADYFPIRDFVGYHLTHSKRFYAKFKWNIQGVADGIEITTDKAIEDLVKPPEEGSTEGYVVAKSANP